MDKYVLPLALMTVILFAACHQTSAQYSNKKVRPKYESYTDSLKHTEVNLSYPVELNSVVEQGITTRNLGKGR